MAGLITFMQGTWGRVLRIVLGIVLIYIGYSVVMGTAGWIIVIIGLVPIVMGVWGPCLLGFLFKKN
jgi:hypothetical protein